MLSKYFSYQEAVFSETATRKQIPNVPNDKQLINLRFFLQNFMDRVRSLFGVPITASSIFRSSKVNKAVGGESTSDHLKGYAADFVVPGYSVQEAMRKIVDSGIEFDQLIDEYGAWIHGSMRQAGNRNQILRKRHGQDYVQITRGEI